MFNKADFPDPHQIQQRFSFATEITPLPSSADFKVDLAQDEVNAIQALISPAVAASAAARAEAVAAVTAAASVGFVKKILTRILFSFYNLLHGCGQKLLLQMGLQWRAQTL